MLTEMGNQNATAIIEDEKDTNEAYGNLSNDHTTEESQSKNDQLICEDGSKEFVDHDEDQTLDHTKEQDEYSEEGRVNYVEHISYETQEIENKSFTIKDDDAEEQEIQDTILDSKSNGKSSNMDELVIQGTDKEIQCLMSAKTSVPEEEKVIDAVNDGDNSSNTKDETIGVGREDEGIKSSMGEENDEEIVSEMDCNDEEIEVVKSMMNTNLNLERYDHESNNLVSPQGSDDDDETEKFYEFAGKSEVEEEKDQGNLDHVADFKDLEMVDSKDSPDCNILNGSLDVERYDQITKEDEFVEKSEEEEDARKADVSDFKDLEVVDTRSSPECNPAQFHQPRSKKNSIDLAISETRDQNQPNQSQISKSPSFNFEIKSPVTRTEESDQTPLLYNNKKAPMRSLSTPTNGRFIAPIVDPERTINTVDCDENPRTPLNGLLKAQPQKIHDQEAEKTETKELCDGNGAFQQGSMDQKRSKSSRVSGSYFFSSCICCSGVQELADP